MLFSLDDIMEYIEDNDVKFVRLVFFDIFGSMKNISIFASELPRALEHGVSFDASEINGFMNVDESDLLLRPDPSTAEILPWRPQHARVLRIFCDICYPDGKMFEGDSRNILKRSVDQLGEEGLYCEIGTECEFYLFELDERGKPTKTPHDNGTYYDVAPIDRGENIRREICLTLEEMGLRPQSSNHEEGPGQHQIIYMHGSPVESADHVMTFKNLVKTVADLHGLFASFMPKPLADKSGNGMHVHLSLYDKKTGKSLIDLDCEKGRQFMAGILAHINEISLCLCPTTNSYSRLGHFEAPRYVTWSHQNRQQLMRIPTNMTGESRLELRSADGSANPYLVTALVIYAGIDGIRNKMELSEPINITYKEDIKGLVSLPRSLEEAVKLAEESAFLKTVLPQNILSTYITKKRSEHEGYEKAENKEEYEQELYFGWI